MPSEVFEGRIQTFGELRLPSSRFQEQEKEAHEVLQHWDKSLGPSKRRANLLIDSSQGKNTVKIRILLQKLLLVSPLLLRVA